MKQILPRRVAIVASQVLHHFVLLEHVQLRLPLRDELSADMTRSRDLQIFIVAVEAGLPHQVGFEADEARERTTAVIAFRETELPLFGFGLDETFPDLFIFDAVGDGVSRAQILGLVNIKRSFLSIERFIAFGTNYFLFIPLIMIIVQVAQKGVTIAKLSWTAFDSARAKWRDI